MDGVTETSIDSTPQELLRVYCALLALLLSPLWVRVLLSCLFAACKTLRSKAAGWQQQRQAAKARHKPPQTPPRPAPAPAAGPRPARSGSPRRAGRSASPLRTPSTFRTPNHIRAPLDDESDSGWDEALLEKCAASSRFISSPSDLQQSPQYQRHIRARNVRLEESVDKQLRVYQALRQTDAEGFSRMFSRQVPAYDEQVPTGWLMAGEYLLRTATSACLLLLPWLHPAAAPWRLHALVVWLLLVLWCAWRSCTSFIAWQHGVYLVHGPYNMAAGFWRTFAVLCAEAVCAGATGGIVVLVSLTRQLVLPARQTLVERLMGVAPLQQVVRPDAFQLED